MVVPRTRYQDGGTQLSTNRLKWSCDPSTKGGSNPHFGNHCCGMRIKGMRYINNLHYINSCNNFFSWFWKSRYSCVLTSTEANVGVVGRLAYVGRDTAPFIKYKMYWLYSYYPSSYFSSPMCKDKHVLFFFPLPVSFRKSTLAWELVWRNTMKIWRRWWTVIHLQEKTKLLN